MEGLYIKKGIEETTKLNSLNLLMGHKNLEVVYGYIPKNGGIIVSAYEDNDIVEFIYVIDGELQYEDNDELITINSGDCFYSNEMKKCITFYAKRDTKIITFSNNGEYDENVEVRNKIYKVLDDIQEKDNYTKGHCKRVALYAQKLANSSKKPVNSMRELMIASNVHDVGKCMIPDEILLKPGRFTTEERQVMMDHSKYTYDLLKNMFGLPETIAMIAACHHERYDGSGYPFGLKGEEIPVEARIIAIADTFDAITTKRPYQEERTPEMALEEMSKFAHEFDEELLTIFKELVLTKQIDVNEIKNT